MIINGQQFRRVTPFCRVGRPVFAKNVIFEGGYFWDRFWYFCFGTLGLQGRTPNLPYAIFMFFGVPF